MKLGTRLLVALAIVAPSAIAVGACVLADPPPLVQIPPPSRPSIVTQSVTPPSNQILTSAPGGALDFSVPVQVDPDQSFKWRVFVDSDPNSAGGAPQVSGNDDGGVLGTTAIDGATTVVRVVDFQLTSSQVDFTRCHWFTFVVAEEFQTLLPAAPVDPPGGDSVSWRYEPGECSAVDASLPFEVSTGDAADDGADE